MHGSTYTTPANLKYMSGDSVRFSLNGAVEIWPTCLDVTEIFEPNTNNMAWRMELSPLWYFTSSAGGAMPSTIERVANYTPLNTSYFDGVLSPSDNNVQAAFDTVDNNVYSKADVDSLIAGASFDFFLDNLASSIGGYYVMGAASGSAESTITAASLATSSVIAAYCTIVGEPNFDTLSAGLYDCHFHAEKTSGSKTLAIYAVLYERVVAGTETAILTFDTSDAITSKSDVDLHGHIHTDVVLAAGSRLVLKLVAVVTGAGSAPTAAVYQEGTTDAHLSVRSTLTAFDGRYAPLTRTITATAPITIDGTTSADLSANRTIAIPAATASKDGYITGAFYSKLYDIEYNAQVNILEGVTGTAPIVAGAIAGKSQAISIPAATASVPGHATAAQITKLDGITAGATQVIAETNAADIFGVTAPGDASVFAALLNGDPTNVGNSVCTFDTVTLGNVAVITPTSVSQLAKMRIYNTTRGTSALILSATGATFTTTTNVYAAGWRNNDVISIASLTLSGGGFGWVDMEITSSSLVGKTAAFVKLIFNNATINQNLRLHPFTASFSASKFDTLASVAASINSNSFGLISLTGNVFCLSWTGTPASLNIREAGYIT
jgi:hypothetical protein